MTHAPCNVLFLCTGNSARSILGEAVPNHVGGNRFRAFSAGSHSKGAVHPLAFDVLARAGVGAEGLRSKPWDEFATPARRLHRLRQRRRRGLPDVAGPAHDRVGASRIPQPSRGPGPSAAFGRALDYMRRRIGAFASLPLDSLDRLSLASCLKGIGDMDGSTTSRPHVA